MSGTQTYTVVMADGFKTTDIEDELMTAGGSSTVPDRAVESNQLYSVFKRIATFELTPAEAENLRADSRVESVGGQRPKTDPKEDEDAVTPLQEYFAHGYGKNNAGNTKVYTMDNSAGLLRHDRVDNPFGTNNGNTGETLAAREFCLTGKGVDFVSMEGIAFQHDHPEFLDDQGNSRVERFDWYSTPNAPAGRPSFAPHLYDAYVAGNGGVTGNVYSAISDHKSGTTSVVAGKTFGYATGAKIYDLPYSLLERHAESDGSTHVDGWVEAFACLKAFHESKNDSRPTVVNISASKKTASYEQFWDHNNDGVNEAVIDSYYAFVDVADSSYAETARTDWSVSNINYRGTDYPVSILPTSFYQPEPDNASASEIATKIANYDLFKTKGVGMTNGKDSARGWYFKFDYSISEYNVAMQECIDAGIIFIRSGGNNSRKIVRDGEADWDNTVTNASNHTDYINRPSSPWSEDTIMVGATTSATAPNDKEYFAEFSNVGSGMDVFALGAGVPTAHRNRNKSYVSPSGSQLAMTHAALIALGEEPSFVMGTSNQAGFYKQAAGLSGSSYEFGQETGSGTSFSAPLVAGLACLHAEANPNFKVSHPKNNAEMKRRLVADAQLDKIYSDGTDEEVNDWDGIDPIGGSSNQQSKTVPLNHTENRYRNSLCGAPNKILYNKYARQAFKIKQGSS